MNAFSSLTILIIASALVIKLILAFLVFRSNQKSATNIIFVFLSIIISTWLVIINEASIPYSTETVLTYTRFSVFFAVPLSVFFFLLAHTLPSPTLLLKKRHLKLLLIFTPL